MPFKVVILIGIIIMRIIFIKYGLEGYNRCTSAVHFHFIECKPEEPGGEFTCAFELTNIRICFDESALHPFFDLVAVAVELTHEPKEGRNMQFIQPLKSSMTALLSALN